MDLPFRKPNWLLFIRPVSCQNLCNLSKTIFSPILQTIEVREIGRSLRDLEPFLCNGLISGHFHSLGNKPEENDLFNICASEGASSDARSLKTQGAILSGPGDLLGLSFKRRCSTSLTLQLIQQRNLG